MKSHSTPPTNVRYSVLLMMCFLAMITYLDRAMYGSAKRELMASVGKGEEDFFWVLVFFQLAYALFEIPTGWMGDTFGPRKTILRIVIWWSFFVALTAFAGLAFPGLGIILITFPILLIMQFLFGMGEAGAFPNISRALYNWFPAGQRGFAQGAIWLSARFMGGLTPFIWTVLVVNGGMSWRGALLLFAGLAALWCTIFYFKFRNEPKEHPGVNDAELELINEGRRPPTGHAGVPWGRIFTHPSVLALCAMYMATNFNWYFLMYYLPGALKQQFPQYQENNSGRMLLALLAGSPMLIGMLGCFLGGVLSDRYIRRTGNRKWGRRIFAMFGYSIAGVCYLSATGFTGNFWPYAICLMLVGFFNDFIMGPSWATAQDIGGRYSAIVSGAMNMVGNLGATLGNLITGLILKAHTDPDTKVVSAAGYTVCFTMYAVVYIAGAATWLLIDPTRSIEADLAESPPPHDGHDSAEPPSPAH